MSGISPYKLKVLAQLQGILIAYDPAIMLPLLDGILSFIYRQVMEQVRDCLTKCNQGLISSEYLEHLQMNIRTLVQQAEEKSLCEELAFFKQIAQKVLYILAYPDRSLECLVTPDRDSKEGQCLNVADPNSSQPGLKRDLIEASTESANADGGICKTPDIHESASAVTRSLNPMRMPGEHDYKPIKLIESGTFGEVHLVLHKDTNKEFAMKTLVRRNLRNPKRLQMAYLERDISIFADFPFIVPMFCSFPTKRHLCMIMEYVAGGDCATLLEDINPLPLPLARTYIAETILAVEYLHSYGVVHRDLKPENLMISSTGHIKVGDFGLSKIGLMRPTSEIYKAPTEDITREFLDKEILGTLWYVAPEVILQEGCGRPIDWWSIGIILHEFLIGRQPFEGKYKYEIFNRILNEDIVWEFNSSSPPPDAQDIITELLRKNPAHRLGTGGANEIKMHPFFIDFDFDKLQSHQPCLESDLDSGYCKHRPNTQKQTSDTNEVNNWPESRNFASSSQRFSKLYTRMMSNGNRTPCPDRSKELSTKHSDVQKESPSTNDGDNQSFTTENNRPSSPTPSVEKRGSSLIMSKEEKTEIIEDREPRRRSIFRRMISSCRRGLSRAARTLRESSIFTVHQRGTLDISKTKHLQI